MIAQQTTKQLIKLLRSSDAQDEDLEYIRDCAGSEIWARVHSS